MRDELTCRSGFDISACDIWVYVNYNRSPDAGGRSAAVRIWNQRIQSYAPYPHKYSLKHRSFPKSSIVITAITGKRRPPQVYSPRREESTWSPPAVCFSAKRGERKINNSNSNSARNYSSRKRAGRGVSAVFQAQSTRSLLLFTSAHADISTTELLSAVSMQNHKSTHVCQPQQDTIAGELFWYLSCFIRKDGCIPFPPALRSVPSVSSQTSLRLLLPLDVSYWKNVGA